VLSGKLFVACLISWIKKDPRPLGARIHQFDYCTRTPVSVFIMPEALSETSQLGAEPSNGSTPKPAVTGQVADIAADS
jgi:hypothetical protein